MEETEKAFGTIQAQLEILSDRIDEMERDLPAAHLSVPWIARLVESMRNAHGELASKIADVESDVELLLLRDLDWYVEAHPEQHDEIPLPEHVRITLWRGGLIDANEMAGFTAGELASLIEVSAA